MIIGSPVFQLAGISKATLQDSNLNQLYNLCLITIIGSSADAIGRHRCPDNKHTVLLQCTEISGTLGKLKEFCSHSEFIVFFQNKIFFLHSIIHTSLSQRGVTSAFKSWKHLQCSKQGLVISAISNLNLAFSQSTDFRVQLMCTALMLSRCVIDPNQYHDLNSKLSPLPRLGAF